MPEDYPDFPHHSQIAAYFDEYVDHFGFRERITFETGVEQARREGDGSWTIELDCGESRSYDALLVANGHHWDPRWPEPAFPGAESFPGEQLHAHSYIDNSIFAGKRVLVLGMGNSAMDIAVESSYVAERTYLSARQGVWIVPKYVFGKPVDQIPNDPRVPFKVRQRMVQRLITSYAGAPERHGLPKPNHRFGEAHPTISGRILDRIQHGTVAPKPNIASFEGAQVQFVDGSSAEVDVVVYCTGYKITFPFFDEQLISAPENHIELSGASFTRSSTTCSSSACCSRWARSCRLRRRRGHGSGTIYAATTCCRRARRYRRTSQPIRPRCASATWPPSATPSRSTSTTISMRLPRSEPQAPRALAGGAMHLRFYADVLPSQPLPRALPDLQQDAAGRDARGRCAAGVCGCKSG